MRPWFFREKCLNLRGWAFLSGRTRFHRPPQGIPGPTPTSILRRVASDYNWEVQASIFFPQLRFPAFLFFERAHKILNRREALFRPLHPQSSPPCEMLAKSYIFAQVSFPVVEMFQPSGRLSYRNLGSEIIESFSALFPVPRFALPAVMPLVRTE